MLTGVEEFSLYHRAQCALWRNQPPMQWVSVAPSLGIKHPEREIYRSPPFGEEIKNTWMYTSIPPIHFHDMLLN
jgi:hypothetical protein